MRFLSKMVCCRAVAVRGSERQWEVGELWCSGGGQAWAQTPAETCCGGTAGNSSSLSLSSLSSNMGSKSVWVSMPVFSSGQPHVNHLSFQVSPHVNICSDQTSNAYSGITGLLIYSPHTPQGSRQQGILVQTHSPHANCTKATNILDWRDSIADLSVLCVLWKRQLNKGATEIIVIIYTTD